MKSKIYWVLSCLVIILTVLANKNNVCAADLTYDKFLFLNKDITSSEKELNGLDENDYIQDEDGDLGPDWDTVDDVSDALANRNEECNIDTELTETIASDYDADDYLCDENFNLLYLRDDNYDYRLAKYSDYMMNNNQTFYKREVEIFVEVRYCYSKSKVSVANTGMQSPNSGICGDNITWQISPSGTLTLSGYGPMYDLQYEIDANLFDKRVSIVLPAWKSDESFDVKEVIFDERITSIGAASFCFCNSLIKMPIFPDAIESINDYAFMQCDNLTGKIIIPDSVKSIGKYAFANCPNIFGNLTIGSSVEEIGKYAFAFDSGIKSLKINDGLVKIEEGVFGGCEGIEYLELSESIKTIEREAFASCSGITGTINLPSELEFIGERAFYGCTKISGDLIIPDNVVTIGSEAFAQCDGLDGKIKIPDCVQYIGEMAFYISNYFYSGKGFSGELIMPSNLAKIEPYTFYGQRSFQGDIVIPEGVESIGQYAFACCENFDGKIVIPDSVKSIDNNAFMLCKSVRSLQIGEGIDIIPENAFRKCSNLSEIIIPNGVSLIKSAAFMDCINAKSVVLPSSIIGIADDAFSKDQDDFYSKNNKENLDITIKCVPGTYAYNWAKEKGFKIQEIDADPVYVSVFFDYAADGVGVPNVSIKYPWGSYVTKPEDPKLDNYNFVGWFFWDEEFDFNKPLTEDVYLIAYWEEYETLQPPYVYNGNDILSSPTVVSGTKIKLLNDESNPNAVIYYSFDEENPTDNCTRYTGPITLSAETDGEIVLYAFCVQDGYYDSCATPFIFNIKVPAQEDIGEVYAEDVPQGLTANIPKGIWFAGIDEDGYSYTGNAIEPTIRVYKGKKLLIAKKDYVLSYRNNVDAALSTATNAPIITVVGIGNYSGEYSEKFTINKQLFSVDNIQYSDILVPYNKRTQLIEPKLYCGSRLLKKGTDYTLSYPKTDARLADYDADAFKNPGTYYITVNGGKNYEGILTVKEIITDANIMSKASVSSVKNQYYTGEPITLDDIGKFTVKFGLHELMKDTHYTVSYKNNTDIGTASIILTGTGKKTSIGTFVGTKEIKFNITGMPISKAKIVDWPSSCEYIGEDIVCDAELVVGDETLIEGQDYLVTYANNKNVGTATAFFTGINAYSGTMKKTFKIKGYDIKKDSDNRVDVTYSYSYPYAKKGVKPLPIVKFNGNILVQGKDYTLSYKNNMALNDGSNIKKLPTIVIKGRGNYLGTLEENDWIIEQQNLNHLEISVPDVVYSDRTMAWVSIPAIYDIDGKALKKGKDYIINDYTYVNQTVLEDGTVRGIGQDVEKTDIVPSGTELTVDVEGIDNYTGDISLTYSVSAKDFSKAKAEINEQIFTGKEVTLSESDILLKFNDDYLKLGLDYKILRYENNVSKGYATVVLRGLGDYAGTKAFKFLIRQHSLSIYKITYELDGGMNSRDNPGYYQFESETIVLDEPTKRGMTFEGWYTDSKFTNPITEIKHRSSGNITLFAKWKPHTYTVNFEDWIGNGNYESVECEYGKSYRIEPMRYYSEDYKFLYWSTDENGGGKRIKDGGTFSNLTDVDGGEVTLYAQWKEI